MAANPGRGANANPGGGGAGNNGPMGGNAEHVEFSVKAEEDLFLTGTETTIRRVTAETNYSCLMLKTQRFSSLFRHYAKYHGLRKDDLEYYFVNLLENEDTPESVQLQRSDTIMVRKRRKPEPPEVAADDDDFFTDMKELLHDDEHMDAVFLIHPPLDYKSLKTSYDMNIPRNAGDTTYSNNRNQISTIIGDYKSDAIDPSTMELDTNATANTALLSISSSSMIMDEPTASQSNMIEIRAHKSVLTARSEYFKAFFRRNAVSPSIGSNTKTAAVVGHDSSTTIPTTCTSSLAVKESVSATVNVDNIFQEVHIRAVLEFVYTNRIATLNKLPTDDILSILHISDMWQLRDLKRICEHELVRSHLKANTVARLYGATDGVNAKRLARACIEFIMSNLRQVTGNASFLEEMKNFPHLMLPVLQAAADLIPEGPLHKKQRTVTTVSIPHNVPSSMHDPHAAAIAAARAGSPPSAAANVAVGVASFRASPVPDSDA